jgi:hypothetical protein
MSKDILMPPGLSVVSQIQFWKENFTEVLGRIEKRLTKALISKGQASGEAEQAVRMRKIIVTLKHSVDKISMESLNGNGFGELAMQVLEARTVLDLLGQLEHGEMEEKATDIEVKITCSGCGHSEKRVRKAGESFNTLVCPVCEGVMSEEES